MEEAQEDTDVLWVSKRKVLTVKTHQSPRFAQHDSGHPSPRKQSLGPTKFVELSTWVAWE